MSETTAVINDERSANIASHLTLMARKQPFAPAIFFPEGRDRRGRARYVNLTYRELDEASDRIARGLNAIGVVPGTRVALLVRPSLELFSLVFALFKARAVPVMIDPGIGIKNMGACLERARPEAFIGVPEAHLARIALRWAKTAKISITVGRYAPWGGLTLKELERKDARVHIDDARPDEVAAILFTSGSTGPPKGAVYTHGNFAAQVDAIRRMYDIQAGEIDLPTFPLFALFDPALGMTTIIPEMDPTRPAKANPRKILDAIETFHVTNMFGSPALLDALSRWCSGMGVKIASLRRVISAGAPVSASIIARMRSILPDDASIVTPYGATECLPVASIESREVLGETADKTREGAGVCVGRPVPEAEVRVIEIDDAPLARITPALGAFVIGEIVVRGPMATRMYFEEPEHDARAKIPDENGTFWHRMGDLGYFDDRGRLWFCGRKSERLRMTPPMYTTPCEGVIDAHPSVYRSALVGIGDRVEPIMCVQLERGVAPSAELERELRALAKANDRTARIERFLFHPGFPVDIRHNAKIKRDQLREWATRQR